MAGQPLVGEMTQHDKIVAASSHAALILPLLGTVVPLVIWTIRGRKSPIVAFQALQAVVYQLISVLGGSVIPAPLICIFYLVSMCNGEYPAPEPSSEPPFIDDPFLFLVTLVLLYLLVVGFYLLLAAFTVLGLMAWLGYVVYGLYGAVATLQGQDFRYAIIGPRLERYLQEI
ncbi:MAG: hypothetical protein CEE40_08950 [Chloroflexi bacterium B3_Chlor]|nr:MAG: hypothetical protein CEE40_08950 [Chloroflexi bacterium B3_Chlor]